MRLFLTRINGRSWDIAELDDEKLTITISDEKPEPQP